MMYASGRGLRGLQATESGVLVPLHIDLKLKNLLSIRSVTDMKWVLDAVTRRKPIRGGSAPASMRFYQLALTVPSI